MADEKISVYNLADLKNTTDDALGNYLRSLSFKQINVKTDVKLVVGYVAVLIAAATFAADYKLGWDATKYWTAVAVVAYGLLNTFFTYWTWYVEKGMVFEATREGRKISIHSKANKHEPIYYLTISVTSKSPMPSEWQIKAPFTTWFTADGYFVAKPFQQWLASSVEMVGDADQMNAMRDQRDELAAPGPEVKVLESAGSATGTEGRGKGTRKSKKKD